MTARTRKPQHLSKQQKAVLDQYVSLLDAVPGPVSVWATTDEGLLHLYTLVSPGMRTCAPRSAWSAICWHASTL